VTLDVAGLKMHIRLWRNISGVFIPNLGFSCIVDAPLPVGRTRSHIRELGGFRLVTDEPTHDVYA